MGQINNLGEVKRKIVSILKLRGPSLPVHVAREVGLDILFASALLSELAKEKETKISNLKVGSSPLYFIHGQEERLEKFSNYLPGKEREAFSILKKKKLIADIKQKPAIRVALRNIKDFAFPLVVNREEGQQLYWRIYSLSEEEANQELKPKTEVKIRVKEKIEKEKPLLELKPQIKGKKPKRKSEFAESVSSLLKSRGIEVIEELESKKRDFSGIIEINSQLGKLNFLVIAKEKKTITENDLTLALQKSQNLKMPALFLTPGELNKKALSYLEGYSGLIKFKRLSREQ